MMNNLCITLMVLLFSCFWARLDMMSLCVCVWLGGGVRVCVCACTDTHMHITHLHTCYFTCLVMIAQKTNN